MKNMFAMIKEAASLQKNMKNIQSKLRQKMVEYSSGEREVTVVARGDGTIAGIRIDPSVVKPDKVRELEKMVLKAVDGALEEAKTLGASEVKNLAAGMGLPDIPGL